MGNSEIFVLFLALLYVEIDEKFSGVGRDFGKVLMMVVVLRNTSVKHRKLWIGYVSMGVVMIDFLSEQGLLAYVYSVHSQRYGRSAASVKGINDSLRPSKMYRLAAHVAESDGTASTMELIVYL